MAEYLVPIALSSQLDVTGEERIHAAKYTPTERPTYVNYDVYFAYQTSEVGASTTGYAVFNTNTNVFTDIANYSDDTYPAFGAAGVNINGKLVIKSAFDNDNPPPDMQSGVKLLSYDGSNSLVEVDHWQIDPNVQYSTYLDIVKYDDTTAVVVALNATGADTYLYALTVGEDSLTLTGTPLAIDLSSGDDYALCMHNEYIIVQDFDAFEINRSLRAYSFDGDDFILEGTYGSALSGSFGQDLSPIRSDGSFIYLSNGMIFTFNGTTFTLVTTLPLVGTGQCLGVIPGFVFMQDGGDSIKVFSFNGVSGTLVQTIAGSYMTANRAEVLSNGTLLFPAAPLHPDSESGIFTWNGSALTRIDKLEIYGFNTYVTLSMIDRLTQNG
jgi:hypothetical protein